MPSPDQVPICQVFQAQALKTPQAPTLMPEAKLSAFIYQNETHRPLPYVLEVAA